MYQIMKHPVNLTSSNLIDLSPQFILSQVSQVEVFEFYMRIPVNLKKSICSPLRKNSHPTCSFAQGEHRLEFTRAVWLVGSRDKDTFACVGWRRQIPGS